MQDNNREQIKIEIENEDNIDKKNNPETDKKSKLRTIVHGISKILDPKYTDQELNTLRKRTPPEEVDTEKIYDSDTDSIESISWDDSSSQYKTVSDIVIKKFNDYRPMDKQYFSKPNAESEKKGISVVIPFFNEESYELQQTLNSLYDSHIELKRRSRRWRDKPLYICLIQDGWHKGSESMKRYLKAMFPKKIRGEYWWDFFEEFSSNFKDTNSNATFIFERKNYKKSPINFQDKLKDIKRPMRITLVIKINNRRKHNSHEWFLAKNGFAESTNGEYLFLTDAFTLYSKTCIFYLVKELDSNANYCAVTGRQRLMTKEQQGSDESTFSFAHWLRMVQLFDFEQANAQYNGAFSIGGLLPVIPGPCGFYRADDLLKDKIRDAYFNVVNEEPSRTGMNLGNLKIAEDRVLSTLAVLEQGTPKSIVFNPLAVFYFEAETDLEKFILQRRRWINGSVAGYIFLLFTNFSYLANWKVNIIRKLYIWFLLMSQFIIYCLVAIAPGISIKILYFGVNYFMNYYGIYLEWELMVIFFLLWAIYIGHVFIHHKSKFNYGIMYILVLLSVATSVVSFVSIFHYAFIYSRLTLLEIIYSKNIVLYLALAVLFMPYLLALLLSGKGHSFMYMIKSSIAYLLFMQMMISWFGSYSYSRTWDLTWGNRPSSELTDVSVEKKTIMIKKFKQKSIRIIFFLILLNFGIFFFPLNAQLGLMSIFFVIALFQMFFSLIFCLYKIFYKIHMLFNRCKRINIEDEEEE